MNGPLAFISVICLLSPKVILCLSASVLFYCPTLVATHGLPLSYSVSASSSDVLFMRGLFFASSPKVVNALMSTCHPLRMPLLSLFLRPSLGLPFVSNLNAQRYKEKGLGDKVASSRSLWASRLPASYFPTGTGSVRRHW